MILCVFILWTQIMSRTGAHSCLLIIQVWAAETLGLAETSLPQIVFVCFIFVYLFISVFCICVYLLVLLFRFGRVVRHWAGCAETSTALHCTAPSTVGVFSALGAGTGSFTLLNNRVRKRAFLSRLSNFISPSRLKPLSCTSHLSHGIRKDFQTQEGPKNCMANKRVRKILSDFC